MALKCERQWTRSGCPVTDRELAPYLVLAATEGMVRPGLSSAHTPDQILKSSNLGKEGRGGDEAGEVEVMGRQSHSLHPNLTLCFGSLDKSLPSSAHWTHFNSVLAVCVFFQPHSKPEGRQQRRQKKTVLFRGNKKTGGEQMR